MNDSEENIEIKDALPNYSPLISAIINNDEKKAIERIERGDNIDGIRGSGICRVTPLSNVGLMKNPYNTFKQLILAGADINLCGVDGYNCLSSELVKSIESINIQFIQHILFKGADPNHSILNLPITTFLTNILSKYNTLKNNKYSKKITSILNLLLCFGANINKQDQYRRTAKTMLDKLSNTISIKSYYYYIRY